MKLDLAEKVALVTGSSKGIGWAIAQTLHAEGCRVTLNGRNEVDLTAATTEVQQVGSVFQRDHAVVKRDENESFRMNDQSKIGFM